MESRTRQLTFRLPEDLIDRVDACTQKIQTQSALPVTRTDVVRMLLKHALDRAACSFENLFGKRARALKKT